MDLKIVKISQLIVILMCSLLVSCSDLSEAEKLIEEQEEKEEETNEENKKNNLVNKVKKKASPKKALKKREDNLITIRTKMTEISDNKDNFSEDKVALSLTSVTKYSIQMEGCLSGYQHITTEQSPQIRAYKFDSNCLAKLLFFEYDGITYNPSTSDPFTTWQVGDKATFEDENDPGNVLYVTVISTLNNPILGTEVVNYAIYHEVNIGDNRDILDVTLGPQGVHKKKNPDPNPTFEIVTVNLIGETLTGGFQVEVILNCLTMMVGDVCGNYNLADTTYILIQDTYNDAPRQNDLKSKHNNSEVAIDLNFDKLLPGEMGATNGGFKTTTGTEILTTPDDVHLNPNMIFSIEGLNESWQYFNVDVVVQSTF